MRTINKGILLSIFAGIMCCVPAKAQQSLSLTEAISIGLKQNFDIEIAAQQSQIAAISNTWGMAGGYPTINLSAGSTYNYNNIIDRPEIGGGSILNTSAKANVQWLLFGGMKVKANKAVLGLKYELAKGTETLQVENTVKSIILAYYSVVLEQELYRLYNDALEISKDIYNREKMAYELGGADTYLLIQAENSYLSDQKRVVQQERTIHTRTYQLNLILNVPIETKWNIDPKIDIPKEEYLLSAMYEKMFANNTSLKNQYVNQKMTEENIRLAQSAKYPQLSAFAELGYGNTALLSGQTSSVNSLTPAVGVTLNYNLYNGGVTQNNIRIAKLNNEINKISTDQIKLYLSSQLSQAFDLYNYTRKLLTLSNREVEVSKTSLDLSFEKFSNGSISSFDFRQVQLAYYQSIYSNLALVFELIQANTEMTQLIGGFITEIN